MTSAEYQQLVEFLGRQFTEIDRRLDEVTRAIAALRQEMVGRFEGIEGEYQAITLALRRIEVAAVDESGRREILERDLGDLKQRVTALFSRIEQIEQRLGR